MGNNRLTKLRFGLLLFIVYLLFSLILVNPKAPVFASSIVYNGEPSWSPNGDWIAYSKSTPEGSDIWIMQVDGTNQTNLTLSSKFNNYHPVWSPNADQIAFMSDRSGNYDIWLVNKDGNQLINLTRDNLADDARPVWSPNGQFIAIESNSLDSVYQIGIHLIEISNFRTIDLTYNSDHTFHFPTWSSDSKSVAFLARIPSDGFHPTRPAGVWVTSIETVSLTSLIQPELDIKYINWSPNGDYMAMVVLKDDNFDVWLLTLKSLILTNITKNSDIESMPVWSPDGSKLAFESIHTDNTDIWLYNLENFSLVNLTINNLWRDSYPAWSPDGNKIAYESFSETGEAINIWTIDLTTLDQINLTGINE